MLKSDVSSDASLFAVKIMRAVSQVRNDESNFLTRSTVANHLAANISHGMVDNFGARLCRRNDQYFADIRVNCVSAQLSRGGAATVARPQQPRHDRDLPAPAARAP